MGGSIAIGILNQDANSGREAPMSIKLSDYGLSNPRGYKIMELFTKEKYDKVASDQQIKLLVPPTSMLLLRVDLL